MLECDSKIRNSNILPSSIEVYVKTKTIPIGLFCNGERGKTMGNIYHTHIHRYNIYGYIYPIHIYT